MFFGPCLRFEVIGVLLVQRLAIKSAHRSTLRCVVSQQCKQLETDPLPCGTLKSCSAVRCQVQGGLQVGLFCPDRQRRGGHQGMRFENRFK
jgi:hypothetical protein